MSPYPKVTCPLCDDLGLQDMHCLECQRPASKEGKRCVVINEVTRGLKKCPAMPGERLFHQYHQRKCAHCKGLQFVVVVARIWERDHASFLEVTRPLTRQEQRMALKAKKKITEGDVLRALESGTGMLVH